MGFCTKCGRPRAGETRFCTGCGAEFADEPDTQFADAPDTQPHPTTQLVDKPASWDTPQDQEYPQTQAVARPSWEAPAEPDHPETQIADKPSWDAAAQQEYPETQAVAKPAFWDQAAAGPAPATLPRMEQPSSAPGQYQQSAGYPDPGQFQPAPQYPQGPQYPQPGPYQQGGQYPPGGGGYSQPDPYQQPGGYPPGGQYPPDYPQPGDASGGGGSGNGRRVALIVVAALVILAAGGGAFAVVSSLRGGSPNAQPSPTLTTSAPPASTPAQQASTAAPIDTSTTPAPPPTTPSPTQSGTVALSQTAAGNSASAQVVDLFNRYFDGINTRNYNEYAGTLDAGYRGQNSQSSFSSGYATTTDSDETITAIYGSGGNLTAVVTFTSRQDPADSVDKKSSCNHWQLTLPLIAQGSGYVIATPSPGYARYTNC
jgi:hypothetical protein